MEEIIQVQEQFYILATSSRVDEHGRVLKHGDTFAVFDRFGNIQRIGLGEQGLYHEGTRFLSRFELRLEGRRPLLLSSTVKEDNALLTVDLTNPDVQIGGQVILPRDQVHVFLSCFLWHGVCYERIRLRNYSLHSVEVSFELIFEADFADIFEVRGLKRARRGELLPPIVESNRVQLSYRGLDEQVRHTTIEFLPPPRVTHTNRAEFVETLPAKGERSFFVTVCCDPPNRTCELLPFDQALSEAEGQHRGLRHEDTAVRTSNEQCNDWLHRSYADLHLMVTQTPHGYYPYAGVPWFSTVFGRDGILTALELLWINPNLAHGVLQYLAFHQATHTDENQDSEPGKILHETRRGEMAALNEIPFGRYYGSVDSTPLFVVLAGAYYERTANRAFIEQLWPNIEAALGWIDKYGDPDGDGFVEYCKRSPNGLVVQGWKDSVDSVFHANGELAEAPVALCEVQGYVYAAKQAAAKLAKLLGREDRASELVKQAAELQRRFEDIFWCEDLGTYALALDAHKQPCRVRTSNPGHCLFSGIVSPQRALRVAETLLSDESFSGWGVRTVSTNEMRFNPMSYHNGSIWPHDNAIIAAGLARYQLARHAIKLFSGLFDASLFVDLHRLPELFCGFVRRAGEGPTLYPVACAPQSWAAGAVFSLLQSILGLQIDAPKKQIRFVASLLPESLTRVEIRNLRVGDSSVDIALERFSMNVGIELIRREGDIAVIAQK
jgi:glycogen debranching enzyme